MIHENKPYYSDTRAAGYIGGRLIRPLLKAGYRVQVVTRDLNHLQGRSWLSEVESMQGNVLDAACLRSILDGIDIAFYLIHSMGDTGAFVERDMLAAETFAKAAADAGVRQIIYLGRLGQIPSMGVWV